MRIQYIVEIILSNSKADKAKLSHSYTLSNLLQIIMHGQTQIHCLIIYKCMGKPKYIHGYILKCMGNLSVHANVLSKFKYMTSNANASLMPIHFKHCQIQIHCQMQTHCQNYRIQIYYQMQIHHQQFINHGRVVCS